LKVSEFFSLCEIENNCLYLPDREDNELYQKFYTKDNAAYNATAAATTAQKYYYTALSKQLIKLLKTA
jgi:hypothetical protein